MGVPSCHLIMLSERGTSPFNEMATSTRASSSEMVCLQSLRLHIQEPSLAGRFRAPMLEHGRRADSVKTAEIPSRHRWEVSSTAELSTPNCRQESFETDHARWKSCSGVRPPERRRPESMGCTLLRSTSNLNQKESNEGSPSATIDHGYHGTMELKSTSHENPGLIKGALYCFQSSRLAGFLPELQGCIQAYSSDCILKKPCPKQKGEPRSVPTNPSKFIKMSLGPPQASGTFIVPLRPLVLPQIKNKQNLNNHGSLCISMSISLRWLLLLVSRK